MKRSVVWLRAGALMGVIAMGLLPLNGVAAAQDTGGVEISRIDLDGFPTVGFDVAVPANLTDGGVGPEAVSVSENGQPVAIDVAPVPTDGLEVVLLIDTSGSMNESAALASAKLAAVAFLDELPAGVPVGVVGFADSPSLVSPLTTDRNAAQSGARSAWRRWQDSDVRRHRLRRLVVLRRHHRPPVRPVERRWRHRQRGHVGRCDRSDDSGADERHRNRDVGVEFRGDHQPCASRKRASDVGCRPSRSRRPVSRGRQVARQPIPGGVLLSVERRDQLHRPDCNTVRTCERLDRRRAPRRSTARRGAAGRPERARVGSCARGR